MPCAEGDETLVPGLPRALVERWAVIIHFLSPVRPYRHAALSQAQPAACTRRVRAARGSDPTPKVAPSTPAGMAEKFSWTREPKLDQGRKIVCWKSSGTVFCTICSYSTTTSFSLPLVFQNLSRDGRGSWKRINAGSIFCFEQTESTMNATGGRRGDSIRGGLPTGGRANEGDKGHEGGEGAPPRIFAARSAQSVAKTATGLSLDRRGVRPRGNLAKTLNAGVHSAGFADLNQLKLGSGSLSMPKSTVASRRAQQHATEVALGELGADAGRGIREMGRTAPPRGAGVSCSTGTDVNTDGPDEVAVGKAPGFDIFGLRKGGVNGRSRLSRYH